MCSVKLSKLKKKNERIEFFLYILEFEDSSLIYFNLFDSSILFADRYVCLLQRLDALICNKLRFGILRGKCLQKHTARLEIRYKDITRSTKVTNKQEKNSNLQYFKHLRIYNSIYGRFNC